MTINRRKKQSLWIVCFLIWPLALWMAYTFYYVNIRGFEMDIILFAILMGVVALFPMTVNYRTIFFVNGVSVTVFIAFGLFAEIMLSAFALMIVFLRLGIKRTDLYRIPLNLLIFAAVSTIGASFYNLVGGTHQPENLATVHEWLAIIGYAIMIFAANQLIVSCIDKFILKRKRQIVDKGMKWESLYSLLYIPVGLILYLLYAEIGLLSVVIAGVPYVFISVILMLLYSYHFVNRMLQDAGEIGHQLTRRLDSQDAHEVFKREVVKLFQVDYLYVHQVTKSGQLKMQHMYTHSNQPAWHVDTQDEVLLATPLAHGESILYKKQKEWSFIASQGYLPMHIQSVLSVPLVYDDEVMGIVTILSSKKEAYEQVHQRILDILASYLAVAIINARYFNEQKQLSQIDKLTGLYNYRFFDNMLKEHKTNHQSCALVLIDLDYFKTINDQWGHEAGNEILQQLSSRLLTSVAKRGIVARYGGEEFVVFLPNINQEQATEMADYLRRCVSDASFTVQHYMSEYHAPIAVDVTASIGVAVYPDHCDHVGDLVRSADRAMYLGAKQQGRNKVSVAGSGMAV